LEAQQKLYPESASKMRHLPIPYMEAISYSLNVLSEQKTVKIVYCGDYNTGTRNIFPLYQAVREMSNVHLTICGASDCTLEAQDNVIVYGRLPWEKVQELEKDADILVHLSNLHGSQIPGKIYQYSGTNKPILFILDGDIEKIKEQFEVYGRYDFSMNDAADIQKTINEMVCSNNTHIPVSEFDKKRLSKQIVE